MKLLVYDGDKFVHNLVVNCFEDRSITKAMLTEEFTKV